MERDFLGIHGKDSKDENRWSRQDSAFLGGSPLQWPFSNDLASMQQILSFKRPHEDGAKIVQFDKHHSSGFPPISAGDAFEATRKPSPVLVQQRSFNLDRQGVHCALQSQSTDSFGATKHLSSDTRSFPVVSAHSIPITTSSPFVQVHGAPSVPNFTASMSKRQLSVGGIPVNVHSLGCNVANYATRNAANSLPMTSQLTIFYAGTVNVYDDVPLDKAQAIMFLASAGSRSNSNMLNQRPETPLLSPNKALGPDGVGTNWNHVQTPTPNGTPSSSSGLPNPISITSLKATRTASSSIKATTDMMVSKASVQTAPTNNNQNEPSKTFNAPLSSPSNVTVMTRAVPQARRASLARFLEKRKERVMDTMPYSCTKKSPDETSSPNKPSSPAIALSSNMEHTWHLGQPKNGIAESGKFPSTKLEI